MTTDKAEATVGASAMRGYGLMQAAQAGAAARSNVVTLLRPLSSQRPGLSSAEDGRCLPAGTALSLRPPQYQETQ